MNTLEAFTTNVITAQDNEYTILVKNKHDQNQIEVEMVSSTGEFTQEQIFASLASGAILYAEYDGFPPLPYEAVKKLGSSYEFLTRYFTLTEIEGILAPPRVLEQRIFGSLME